MQRSRDWANGRDIANPARPTCSRRRCARADELAKDLRLQQTLESEASISRYKRVIGDTLKSREDARRVTEVAIAIKSLNRMRKLGQANIVRVA
jgi:hypothetical protein